MHMRASRAGPGWHNSGYIFPEGFASRVNFRSSLVLDALCVHECAILGPEGQFWPAPTFRVTAMDRPQEPLLAKSCTGCWSGVRACFGSSLPSKPSPVSGCSMCSPAAGQLPSRLKWAISSVCACSCVLLAKQLLSCSAKAVQLPMPCRLRSSRGTCTA
jgi:hypothetical protein